MACVVNIPLFVCFVSVSISRLGVPSREIAVGTCYEESSDEWLDSESNSSGNDPLYIPTPECQVEERVRVSPVDLPRKVGFIDLLQLQRFIDAINASRGCRTPMCTGALVPVYVKSVGLGGALSISFSCDGCGLKHILFESSARYELENTSEIGVCVQVAFIVAGSTHATYAKTLKHALGISAVYGDTFYKTIKRMHPIVKAMLDEVCEIAKQEMKDKRDDELGSWKRAVTTADATWQTRGWHSKNASFSMRNYLNGALLYYQHLCQKGRGGSSEELYKGTSKSAEGYAARVTCKRAKEEGMQIAVHWQDADSSSAKAVTEVFPDAEIMLCGGHAGRAHKKILESWQKRERFPQYNMINKYGDDFPAVRELICKCRGNHSANCGCLSTTFISKAHINFMSILMKAQSQDEFVSRITALAKHARDVHEWEGGNCDFHPLRVCTCGGCSNKEKLTCEGKPFETRLKLRCAFHALAYEIECNERAAQVQKLVHPILKHGHTNAVEASHNVLIRFRSKDISLEKLHYELSTILGLLQSNLTYMHAKFGTSYHWIPELFRRMKLPVFDGVLEALQKHSVQRKKALDKAKTAPKKRRRIALKKKRVIERMERKKWTKKHGRDTYGGDTECEVEHEVAKHSSGKRKRKAKKGSTHIQQKCPACGSSAHRQSSHNDCPKKSSVISVPEQGYVSADELSSPAVSTAATSDCSDDEQLYEDSVVNDSVCTCGADSIAHKGSCPMSSRTRFAGCRLFPTTSEVPSVLASADTDVREPLVSSSKPPPSKKRKIQMNVGDYVCVHCQSVADVHVPCRIVECMNSRFRLYCTKGILNTSYSGSELIPFCSSTPIPLDNWRKAPSISLLCVSSDPAVAEQCNCSIPVCSENVLISSSSEDENMVHDLWVDNCVYSLSHKDRELVITPTGWLTDKIITAAQMLILQHFPSMAGLQPPALQKVLAFEVHSGGFVQIINVANNHWCLVSTVGCSSGVVNVYDSLHTPLSDETTYLIASMISTTTTELRIVTMDVEKQTNSSDCGVLAIAYAFDICSGLNPCSVRYNQKNVRQHLVMCLEKCQFARFPLVGERRSRSGKAKTVELHCSCRMPEREGDKMAECESCQVWYHHHCIDIPCEVFGDTDMHWVCKACI